MNKRNQRIFFKVKICDILTLESNLHFERSKGSTRNKVYTFRRNDIPVQTKERRKRGRGDLILYYKHRKGLS